MNEFFMSVCVWVFAVNFLFFFSLCRCLFFFFFFLFGLAGSLPCFKNSLQQKLKLKLFFSLCYFVPFHGKKIKKKLKRKKKKRIEMSMQWLVLAMLMVAILNISNAIANDIFIHTFDANEWQLWWTRRQKRMPSTKYITQILCTYARQLMEPKCKQKSIERERKWANRIEKKLNFPNRKK